MVQFVVETLANERPRNICRAFHSQCYARRSLRLLLDKERMRANGDRPSRVAGHIAIHVDGVGRLPGKAGSNTHVARGAPVDAAMVATQVRYVTGPRRRGATCSTAAYLLAGRPSFQRRVGLRGGSRCLEIRQSHG